MKRILDSLILFFLFASLMAGCAVSEEYFASLDNLSSDQRQELGWLETSCLQSEYGTDRGRVIRWAKNPTITTMGASAAERSAAVSVISELNTALASTSFQFKIVNDGDTSADFQIHFGTLQAMQTLAKSVGANFGTSNDAIFWTWWNNSYEMTKAKVFVATDTFPSTKLRSILLVEITQSIGPQNDSTFYKDSVTYEDDRGWSSFASLPERDKKLLRFLYKYTQAGDSRETFELAYLTSWSQL